MLYYYSRLSEAMQHTYHTILDGIQRMRPSITLSGRIDPDALPVVISAVDYDHPELFWWCSAKYHFSIGPRQTKVFFQYIDLSPYEIRARCAKLMKWKLQVTEAVTRKSKLRSLSTVDKVWLIGDHLASRMTYSDSEAIPFADRHSIWGAYAGAGVCESIAKGFQFMVSDNLALQINGIYVVGNYHDTPTQDFSTLNHAWNAVVEDGYIFHFDLTAQIQRAHIHFLGASKALYFTPEQMKGSYSLCVPKTSPLHVPQTCHKISIPGE